MGGCTSREKGENDITTKTSLNTKEIEKCKSKYQKLCQAIEKKHSKTVSLECFLTAFPENLDLGEKVYKWLNSSTQTQTSGLELETLILSIELLTKPKAELYMQSYQFKNIEQFQLLLLISLMNPEIMKIEVFNPNMLRKIDITYLQAGIFIKEIINIMSRKGTVLSIEDDLAPKILINQVFGNKQSQMDLPQFCNTLKMDLPYINDVIRRYFAGKFTNKLMKIRLPTWSEPSQIINDQVLGLFVLSTQWLSKIKNLKLVHRYKKGVNEWNFQNLAECLLNQTEPTIMLFQHSQLYNKYDLIRNNWQDDIDHYEQLQKFGFYCSSQWKIQPEISGDVNSSVFSIVPKYKQFTTTDGQGQQKYATLSTKFKQNGIGIGGSGIQNHRIWIDGEDLTKSYVNIEDKTYQEGNLIDFVVKDLNIELIEVWTLQQQDNNKSEQLFRQTVNNHINNLALNETKPQSSSVDNNDINNVISSIRKSTPSTQKDKKIQDQQEYDQHGFQVEPVQSS